MTQTTNAAGLKLIESFEGCKLEAYKLDGEKYYTIGYGHSFDNSITAKTVWTQKQADDQLKKDLHSFEAQVTACSSKHGFKFNDNQFAALVSYTYNRGAGGLEQLLSHSKTVSEVGKNLVVYWGSATAYKTGLVNRRKSEEELFNKAVPKPPVKPSTTVKHTVKSGDTLSAIAASNGTTVAQLKSLNGLKSDLIKVGQVLIVKK